MVQVLGHHEPLASYKFQNLFAETYWRNLYFILHYEAKSMWPSHSYLVLWFFPKLLPESTQLSQMCLYAVALQFFFTRTVTCFTMSVSFVHKKVVCQICSGRTHLWPQPHWTPWGMNWNTDRTPDLHTQNQCLSSPMLLWLNEKKRPPQPRSSIQWKAFPEHWSLL